VLKTVFVNGIWKSGNHMLIKLLKLMGVPFAEFGISAASLVSSYYPVRRIVRGPRWEKSPVNIGLEIPVNVGKYWVVKKIRHCYGKCFGGHAAYSDHLLSILRAGGVRPLQIIRDPRDIVCSFVHWVVNRPDYYAYKTFSTLSIEERMLAVINGIEGDGLYFESIATVLDRSYGWITRPAEVLVVRFEDLVGAQGGGDADAQKKAVGGVAEWVGVRNVDIERIAKSLFGGTATFRRGKSGSWEEEFTPAVRSAFERTVGDRIRMWGYE